MVCEGRGLALNELRETELKLHFCVCREFTGQRSQLLGGDLQHHTQELRMICSRDSNVSIPIGSCRIRATNQGTSFEDLLKFQIP